MPILKIYGVPDDFRLATDYPLPSIIKKLQEAVVLAPELRLKSEQVSIFFPRDLCQEGLGEEVICFVEGLFNKPERTKAVRTALAYRLLAILMDSFPKAKLCEVLVKKFHGDDGYASSAEEL